MAAARSSSLAGPASRADWLDLLKTLLVWGMVGAHVVQLLGVGLGPGAARFSDYINLVSFSGFMLAFGIGTGLSPGRRRSGLAGRIGPALVMLGCAYLSALAFATLVDHKPITGSLLADLLTFRVLFGYSEFLATFFVLYVVIALARPVLIGIAENPVLLAAAVVVCLASTYVATGALIPLAGTVIGHTRYASFPLLGYLPWFLFGIRIGRRDGVAAPFDMALAILGTAVFLWFFWRTGQNLPERFPPTIQWIVGPAVPLLVYLVACRAIADWVRLPFWLMAPGRHVLAALLLSNLIIFATRAWRYKPAHPLGIAIAIAVLILIVVTLWCNFIDRLAARRRRNAA